MKMPKSPFTTRLSGSAKETELRLRNIFQWKKKRPPVVLFVMAALVMLLCFSLFSCVAEESPKEDAEKETVEAGNRYAYFFQGDVEQKQQFMAWEAEYALTYPEEYNSFDAETYFKNTFTNPIWELTEDQVYAVEDYLATEQLIHTETFEDRMRGHWLIEIWREELGRATVESAGYTEFETPYWKMMQCDSLENFLSGGCDYADLSKEMTLNEYGEMITALQEDLAAHPEEYSSFDAEAYQRDYLSYPYGELGMYNWCNYKPMDYSREDYQQEITAIWLYDRYAGRMGNKEPVSATQEVLNYVDAVFALDSVDMQCWLFPGTGPVAVGMEDYYAQVREVFARYNWTYEPGEEPEREVTLDQWSMYINSTSPYNIVVSSNSNWVNINGMEYSYNGAPGELIDALANLWDGPDIRHAQILLPETIEDIQTLAEAYEAAFRELYLNSGAITEYELQKLEVVPAEGSEGEYPAFRIAYAVKPSDPGAPCWKNDPVDEDGWAAFYLHIPMTKTGYDHIEESVWRCSWYWPVD